MGVCAADYYVLLWDRVDVSEQIRVAGAFLDFEAEQWCKHLQPRAVYVANAESAGGGSSKAYGQFRSFNLD